MGREVISERNDDITVEEKSFTFTTVGYIGELTTGDGQRLSENLSVTGSLIEHVDKIRVFKYVLNFAGSQKVLYILGYTGRDAAPFSKSLPDLDGVGCCLFLLEQEVKFVNIEPGVFVRVTVFGNTTPDLIVIGNLTLLP